MSTPSPLAPIAFILQTIVSQIIAIGATLLAWEVTQNVTCSVIAASFIAGVCATFLRFPKPWMVVNMALPLALAGSLAVSLPSWIFAIPFAALALLHAPALWTRVPYYPTSRAAYPLILAELPPETNFTFIDIGCGCGDLLLFLRQHRPLGTYYGVEIGVLPFVVSKIKALLYGRGSISIHFQDLKRTPLNEFDYVYAFLSPAAMTQVWQKANREMKPGSTFITNSFEVPAQAAYIIAVKDARRSSLFVHRMTEQCVGQTRTRIS